MVPELSKESWSESTLMGVLLPNFWKVRRRVVYRWLPVAFVARSALNFALFERKETRVQGPFVF